MSGVSPAAWLLGALLLGAGLHLGTSQFPVLLGGLGATLLLAVLAFAAAACGRLLLRPWGESVEEADRSLLGATLGLGLLSQAVFLLGLLGLLKTPWLCSLAAAFWLGGVPEFKPLLRSLREAARVARARPAWALGLGVLAALSLACAWLPPHQYDALVYHLPMPAAYLRSGRIEVLEHLLYSHFPQNAEMLFALGLGLGSESLAQLFSWLGAALSAAWLWRETSRRGAAAPLAALLLLSHTAVLLLAPIAYVECLLMLWSSAAVLCFARWREAPASRGWLVLSGVFCGLGVGTKYTGGITPALLAAALVWRLAAPPRADSGARARDLLLFCSAAFLCGLPWLAKNACFIGNPVFPFLHEWLPARGVPWPAETAQRYFRFLTEYGHRGRWLEDILLLVFQVASGSARLGGGADVLGSLGWAPLLALLPAALWAARRDRADGFLLAYSGAHAALWFASGAVLRFLVPIAPLLCLPCAQGAAAAWEGLDRGGRAVWLAGLGALLALNLGQFAYVHAVFESLPVWIGLEGRDAYLARKLDYAPCAQAARGALGQNDRILVVGEQRGYPIHQSHATTTPMAPNPFVRMADLSADPEDLARRLRGAGFSHLLWVPREARRLAPYGVLDFGEPGRRNWAGLAGRLRLLYEDPGRCALYALP